MKNPNAYMKKMRERESEIIWKDGPLTDAEKLELIICSIQPYSKWWRWGYIKALRRAIKLIKEDDNKKKEQKHTIEPSSSWDNSYDVFDGGEVPCEPKDYIYSGGF